MLKSSTSKLQQINEMLKTLKIADSKIDSTSKPSTSIQTLNNTSDNNLYDNSNDSRPIIQRLTGKKPRFKNFKNFYSQPIPNF